MNRPVHPEARDIWRKWYRPALEELFSGYSEHGQILTPDRAMEEMKAVLKSVFCDPLNEVGKLRENAHTSAPFVMPQFDWVAFEREAHKYAVDLYYKTYFPKGRGAPVLTGAALHPLLELQRQGLGYKAIADRVGLTKDTVRDRLTGRKRKRAK